MNLANHAKAEDADVVGLHNADRERNISTCGVRWR
jgi:hypothetical protein